MLNITQIEVTTVCNYSCWYCTGRQMEQGHMAWETFTDIVDKSPKDLAVMLQGEGEPTLWVYWWKGLEYLKNNGFKTKTILNGSSIDVQRLATLVDNLGISLDTIDPIEGEKLGRFNVPKVVRNILELKEVFKERLTIHITDYGQDLKDLKMWLAHNHLNWIVQPLQTKESYVTIYPKGFITKQDRVIQKSFRCIYTSAINRGKFYNLRGIEVPCCYVKEVKPGVTQEILQSFDQGQVPKVCSGCKFI